MVATIRSVRCAEGQSATALPLLCIVLRESGVLRGKSVAASLSMYTRPPEAARSKPKQPPRLGTEARHALAISGLAAARLACKARLLVWLQRAVPELHSTLRLWSFPSKLHPVNSTNSRCWLWLGPFRRVGNRSNLRRGSLAVVAWLCKAIPGISQRAVTDSCLVWIASWPSRDSA